MKKGFYLLAVIFLTSFLSGCGTSASDISELYKEYTPVDKASNKAGISISKIEMISDTYNINVFASNPVLSQSEENAAVTANRLRVFNAEEPDTEVEHRLSSVSTITIKPDGTQTHAFYPAVNISKSEKAKFVIIYFEGISKEEAPELETPPLFFIVELNKKEPKTLTQTPLLAGDLFK